MNLPLTNAPATTPGLRLEMLFPSHTLAAMREFVERIPALSPLLQELLPVRLYVLDANIIQGELRWRLKKRRDPSAKSGLQEVIESGIIIAVAPAYLKLEIEKYLHEIAVDCQVSATQVQEEWEKLHPHLHFYQPHQDFNTTPEVADPKDLPYKDALEELGATAVFSRDRHLRAMDIPVVADPLDLTLRNHARAASVVIGTHLGSGVTIAIGIETVGAIYRLIKRMGEQFMKLPFWAQIGITLAVTAAFTHPKPREKIGTIWQSICSTSAASEPSMLVTFAEIMKQFSVARDTTSQTYKEIQSISSSVQKQTAIMHARRICLISKESLPVAEIIHRMRNQGYVTRSKNFASYLRRLLRTSGQFIEKSPGFWTLQRTRTHTSEKPSAGPD